MILYMYIALGHRQTAARGQSFDVNRNVLSLNSFVASFKEISHEIPQNVTLMFQMCSSAYFTRLRNVETNRKQLS